MRISPDVRIAFLPMTAFVALLVCIGWLSITPAEPLAADEKPAAKPSVPQPVVDTHELMELFNEPLYESLKEEIKTEPKTDKEWKRLRNRGYQAAEIANLTAIREDAESPEEWEAMSREARQRGLDLAEAAKTKDFEKTQSAYRALIKNCNTCHQKTDPAHAPQLDL